MRKIFILAAGVILLPSSCGNRQNADSIDDEMTNKEKIINNLVNNMVEVEGGTFIMGSNNPDAPKESKPAHEMTVSSFKIGRYEVTQAEWEAVMGSNPSHTNGSDHPVEMVTWDDCQVFIDSLNKITGKTFRLPTEAEWEYAAKGGNKSKGYKYSGSDKINEVAWYGSSLTSTHPVGEKAPNELGLYDMTGNVSEWTADFSTDNYSTSRKEPYHTFRGGDIWTSANGCLVIGRGIYSYAGRYFYLGLRLAM